jgi:hypothetical protein
MNPAVFLGHSAKYSTIFLFLDLSWSFWWGLFLCSSQRPMELAQQGRYSFSRTVSIDHPADVGLELNVLHAQLSDALAKLQQLTSNSPNFDSPSLSFHFFSI